MLYIVYIVARDCISKNREISSLPDLSNIGTNYILAYDTDYVILWPGKQVRYIPCPRLVQVVSQYSITFSK